MRALVLLLCVGRLAYASSSLAAARTRLEAFDKGHRNAAATGGEGMGGALSANAWAATADKAALADAVRTVSSSAERVMLGFCADDAGAAIAALKYWVSALGLPRGTLHGMDANGVPLDMSTFGACYVKYNSLPTGAGDPAGSAMLSGYGGDFRGVYFSPDLGAAEEFCQYGVLPLDLWGGDSLATSRPPPAARVDAPTSGAGGPPQLGAKLAEQAVAQLQADVQAAGGSLRLLAASADGKLTVSLLGPTRLRYGVEVALRASKLLQVREVVFADDDA